MNPGPALHHEEEATMPRKRQPEQHIYSVYVDFIADDGTLSTSHVYFGNSKFAAQVKLAVV